MLLGAKSVDARHRVNVDDDSAALVGHCLSNMVGEAHGGQNIQSHHLLPSIGIPCDMHKPMSGTLTYWPRTPTVSIHTDISAGGKRVGALTVKDSSLTVAPQTQSLGLQGPTMPLKRSRLFREGAEYILLGYDSFHCHCCSSRLQTDATTNKLHFPQLTKVFQASKQFGCPHSAIHTKKKRQAVQSGY
jgi:hypothetical protein